MPQSHAAAPGGFAWIMQRVTEDLERVHMERNAAIAHIADPQYHIDTIRTFFPRLEKRNLKLAPSRARIDAMEDSFLRRLVIGSGLHPGRHKASALSEMPVLEDVGQLETCAASHCPIENRRCFQLHPSRVRSRERNYTGAESTNCLGVP